MNIADRIQNLRRARGISQEQLADKVGVSRQAVSKWESEQSVPDLDKIIVMSEYFDVTTDYILKGIEPAGNNQGTQAVVTSTILYIASTAFLAIGLFCAFGAWYEQQTAVSIWGSMIIQAVGAAGYFIGRLLSGAKAPFAVNWANILLAAFMPLSLIVAVCFRRVAAPYPTDAITGIVFAAVYLITAGLSFAVLKRRAIGR
ncbi:helix-turn-helix domain-containing protein [Bacillota bacterium Meth-B3]